MYHAQDDMEAAVDKALTSADFPRAPAPAAVAPAAEVRAAPAAAAAVKEPEKKVSPVVTRCAILDALQGVTYPITYAAETVVLCHQGYHACALTYVQLLHGHMRRNLCNLQGRRPSPSEMRPCRSMEEDLASPRGEPAKVGGLAKSKWVMVAVAVAAVAVGLYTFRDTFLAGSVNARLLRVYALVCQVGHLLYHLARSVSMQAAACEDWLRCVHRGVTLGSCAVCWVSSSCSTQQT